MPDNPHELAAHLFDLEQQLLQPSTRRDATALTSLLTEDFREFGSSGGVYTRQQVIDLLAAETPRHITLSDPLCRQLAEDIALLTYRSARIIARQITSQALRSSLWVRRNGRWQMLFHLGTRI
jgi:glyoxylase I family protein